MGKKTQQALRLQFDRWLRLQFHAAGIAWDAGFVACPEPDGALALTEKIPSYVQETKAAEHRVLLADCSWSRPSIPPHNGQRHCEHH